MLYRWDQINFEKPKKKWAKGLLFALLLQCFILLFKNLTLILLHLSSDCSNELNVAKAILRNFTHLASLLRNSRKTRSAKKKFSHMIVLKNLSSTYWKSILLPLNMLKLRHCLKTMTLSLCQTALKKKGMRSTFDTNLNWLSSSRPLAFAVLFATLLKGSQAILFSTSELSIKMIVHSIVGSAWKPLRKSSICKTIKVFILIAEMTPICNAKFARNILLGFLKLTESSTDALMKEMPKRLEDHAWFLKSQVQLIKQMKSQRMINFIFSENWADLKTRISYLTIKQRRFVPLYFFRVTMFLKPLTSSMISFIEIFCLIQEEVYTFHFQKRIK